MKLILFCACAGIFFLIFGSEYPFMLIPTRTSFVTLGVFTLVYMMMNIIYGGFDIGKRKSKPIIYSFILSLLFTDITAHFFMCIMNITVIHHGRFVYDYPLLLILAYLLQIAVIITFTYGGNYLYFSIFKPHDSLIVTRRGEQADNIVSKIGRYKKQYNITGVVFTDDPDILKKIDRADSVFFYNLSVPERNSFVEYCYHCKKDIYYSVELSDIVSVSSHRVFFDDKSMVYAPVKGLTFEQRVIKRLMDLLIAGLGLIITSPIFLITAICIKLEDGGPVFYKQERATYAGRVFSVIKFRSMRAEDGSVHKSVTKNDDRITHTGRIIRKFRIDELPQLLNIFKGDMSVVGPRPERPEIAKEYEESIPEFAYRLKVKAGLTGYAQIYGKYNTTAYDKLKLDLMYIESYSILEDLKLILATFKIVFTKESTEGLEEGQTISLNAKEEEKKDV